MEILAMVRDLQMKLREYVPIRSDSTNTIPDQWITTTIFHLLGQYPSGLTQPLLLSQLESLWQRYLKIGTHSTKLRQILKNPSKLQSSDVLKGSIFRMDDLRHIFTEQDNKDSMGLILHRQINDLRAYLEHSTYPLYLKEGQQPARKCLLTMCRTLRVTYVPALLASELIVPIFDYSHPYDRALIQTSFIPLHESFSNLASFEDAAMQGVFASVVYISGLFEYPTHFNKQYRVIKLRVRHQSQRRPMTLLLILYDDQVHLASVWKEQDMLFIYRPYLMMNCDELLFGSSVDHSSQSFQHKEIHRTADIIASLTASSSDCNDVQSFHLLYGCITVCCLVENMEFNDQPSELLSTVNDDDTVVTSHRRQILAKYGLKETEFGLIDVSRSKEALHPGDVLSGMVNVAFCMQIVDTAPQLHLIPLPLEACECAVCSYGVYILQQDHVDLALQVGDVVHVNGLHIKTTAVTTAPYNTHRHSSKCRRDGASSTRIIACSASLFTQQLQSNTTSNTLEVIRVSKLAALLMSPSIFAPVMLIQITTCESQYTSISVVNAYISKYSGDGNDGGTLSKRCRTSVTTDDITVVLMDGTCSAVATLTTETLFLSTHMSLLKAKDLSVGQLVEGTALVSSRWDQQSGGRRLIVHALGDMNVCGQAAIASRQLLL